MKKRRDLRQEKPHVLKKRLMASLSMLLIASIMMSTTTFAWFVLSTAPEVTGIETQVGANGSLEIALLNTDTRGNMADIRAGLGGGSLQEDQIEANNVWGNLVDLSFASYGLGELTLLPARLDATASGEDYTVDVNKLLAVPNYGYDGRIIQLTHDTASAIYQESGQNVGFLYSGAQDYGVRAIGTSDALSPQGSALNSAKSNISTWSKSAKSGAQSALTQNMDGLFAIIIQHTGTDKFTDEHKDTLVSMLTELGGVVRYLDNSLRQGLVAYVASEISDEALFTAARDRILNTDTPLSTLLTEATSVPATFSDWVNKVKDMQNDLNLANTACAGLTDNDYTWAEIKGVMEYILNTDALLINGKTMDQVDPNSLLGSLIKMDLKPESGLFAEVADFTGNYTVYSEFAGQDVEMSTASTVNPAYLAILSGAVNELAPADGGETASALPLTATYGYAIDLAFRCNAANPNLVLQTEGVQRVYNGSEYDEDALSSSTQGGGSYMEFTSSDEDFTLEQQLELMDAIRVGFIDDQGKILAIAKLSTRTYDVDGDVVKAPLYLYNYTFEADTYSDGLILNMGGPTHEDIQTEDQVPNQITELDQNVAKAVTAVVWLDGDIVDNTMVSATAATSLSGVLNLQFATSAELVPAVDGSVMTFAADKSGLEEAMALADPIATAGQGKYTNVSWNEFITAYHRAEDVNNNTSASHIEIRNAVNALEEAMPKLVEVSKDALNTMTGEVRTKMGTTTGTTGAYVVDMGVDGYAAVTEYTTAEQNGWTQVGTIESVNHELNKNDEGNGVYTEIYTEASWNALAGALYQAEAVAQCADATDDQIDSALTALDEAQKALEFAVYYVPYDYNGSLYYMAKCDDTDEEGTYGRWYDANFKRVFADVTLLKLDAYAKPTSIAQIAQNAVVPNTEEYITPDIGFLTEVFSALKDVEVKGVHWDTIDSGFFTEQMGSGHYNRLSQLVAMVEGESADEALVGVDVTAAKTMMSNYDAGTSIAASEAESTIDALTSAIVNKYTANKTDPDAAMSDDARFLLTTAVNSAKATEGYDSNAALKSATESAETLLADGATNQQAEDALAALNAQLENDVTAENTIVHKIPGFDSSEFVYDANYPGITLKLNDNVSGTTTLGATILTEDGVVTKVSREIKICHVSTGVKVGTVEGEQVTPVTAIEVKAGATQDVQAVLQFAAGIGKDEAKDTVSKYTWASKDTGFATVSGSEKATITGVTKGSTTIVLAVETVCGKQWTCEVTVNVTE